MTIVKPKALDAGFQTPWEKSGEEIDPEKARVFVHYLTTEAWNAAQSVKAVTKERDDLQTKLDEAANGDNADVVKLQAEVAKEKKRADDAEAKVLESAKFEVALEKGLTKTQAKRLQGGTREELEADADELRTDLGLPDPDDDGDRGDEALLQSLPASRVRTAGDPKPREKGFDLDAEADAISRRLSGVLG